MIRANWALGLCIAASLVSVPAVAAGTSAKGVAATDSDSGSAVCSARDGYKGMWYQGKGGKWKKCKLLPNGAWAAAGAAGGLGLLPVAGGAVVLGGGAVALSSGSDKEDTPASP